jgi:BirA family transcriptional regulator, biotin operon repressor / biotin---[acetyl-CoA-carboxylase] ligase
VSVAGAGQTDTSVGLGTPRLHLRRTDSTNERCRDLAGAGAVSGTLVTAAEQTAGRGRHGRSWSAPPGDSLLMSLLLRRPPALLALIAAVAVGDAVGERTRIKWPNDIVFAEEGTLRKLAGILIEGRPQEDWAVLGIGVNVAVSLADLPTEVRGQAATLAATQDDVEPLLASILVALARRLAEPESSVLEAWRARDALLGSEVEWGAGSDGSDPNTRAQGRGRATGIDDSGRLLVALADGAQASLGAGEVHLRSQY